MTAWPVNVRVTLGGSDCCCGHMNVCVCRGRSWLPGGRGRHLSPAQKEVTLKGYGNDRDSAALQRRTAPLAKQMMLQGATQTPLIMFFIYLLIYLLPVQCQNWFNTSVSSIVVFVLAFFARVAAAIPSCFPRSASISRWPSLKITCSVNQKKK